jgi:hypothetical protein
VVQYDLRMITNTEEPDKFLRHRIFGLQKQDALLSARRLEDTLCSVDRTPYSWDFRENTRGMYPHQSYLLTPTVPLFSQMLKNSFGNANLVSRSFACYQKKLESGLSSTSDGESTCRCSSTPSLSVMVLIRCFRACFPQSDLSIKSSKRPFRF